MTESILTKKKEADLFTVDGLSKQTGTPSSEWDMYAIKELTDNALDACESAGVEPKITVTIRGNGVTIRDNGPGITIETVNKIVDLNIYAGSKYYFARPSRGKQGNALLTLLPMPYVLSEGKIKECAIIRSGTKQYIISVEHDDVEQDYNFRVDESDIQDAAVQGTEIKINISYADTSKYAVGDSWQRLFNYLMNRFSVFNPHCEITTDYFWEVFTYQRKGDIRKMKSESESIHWYSYQAFRDLIYAYIRAGHGNTTIKNFCMERFRGVNKDTGNEKLLKSMRSKRLEDLRDNEEDLINLYNNVKTICLKVLDAGVLGEIGKNQLKAFFSDGNKEPLYKENHDNIKVENGGYVIPYVLEGVATQENDSYSRLYAGLNNSPLYDDSSLSRLLDDGDLKVDKEDGIQIALHLICPNVRFTDYSKRRFDLSPFMPAIRKVLRSILSDYYDSRDKALKERDKSFKQEQKQKEENRKKEKKEKKDKKREVFFETITSVYNTVTNGGLFPTDLRHGFYHHRPLLANRSVYIDYDYFAALVAEWEIQKGRRMFLREARGVLLLPGSNDYIHIDTKFVNDFHPSKYKFNKIIYIEKRSFMDALRAYDIHNRYDIALIGGQGQPTEDIKLLIHKCIAADSGISVYVFHDCDIYGLQIFNCTSDEHYIEKSQVSTVSLGIKPTEVITKNYPVEYYEAPRNQSGKVIMFNYEELASVITPEEFKWLTELNQGKRRRVELNIFTPLDFVKYTEDKLVEYGITEKVLPPVEEIKKTVDAVVEKEKGEVVKKTIDKYTKEITDLVDKLKAAIIKRDNIEKNLIGEFKDYVKVDSQDLRDKVGGDLTDNPHESWEQFTVKHVKEQFDDLPEWEEHVKEIVNNNTNSDVMMLLTSVLEEKLQK